MARKTQGRKARFVKMTSWLRVQRLDKIASWLRVQRLVRLVKMDGFVAQGRKARKAC